MDVKIAYATKEFFESFHSVLDQVAREQIYIEMIEAKSLKETEEYQNKLIEGNQPVYYVVQNSAVVGWIDISTVPNKRLAHRGFLGMGLAKEFRGMGLGSLLLEKALSHAKSIGLEKIELQVYTNNEPAIRLYKKYGFSVVGTIKHYRKLNGQYFDCLYMEKFL